MSRAALSASAGLLGGRPKVWVALPTCSPPGIFGDVPCPSAFAVDWIEQLYHEGIAAGCQANPPLYCPDDSVTRGQMAVFLTTTFNLP